MRVSGYGRLFPVLLLLAMPRTGPAQGLTQRLTQGSAAPALLTPGVDLTRPLAPDAPDYLAVPAAAGQFVRIVVMQTGTDVAVTLRDSDGRGLMTSDLPNGAFGAETVAAVAGSGGRLLVEVRSLDSGSYRIRIDALRDATPDDIGLGAAYRALSEAESLRQEHTPAARTGALEILERIRPLFAGSGDPGSGAMANRLEFAMLAESGDVRGALSHASETARLYHEAGDPAGEAAGLNNAGAMLDLLGDLREALASYTSALRLTRATGNTGQEALLLSNTGKIEGDLRNWQNALEDYNLALPLARRSGNSRVEASALHNIGAAHWHLGDFEDALRVLEQALPLRRTANDRRGEGDTLEMLAEVCRSLKRPADSLRYRGEALSVYTALGDRRGQAIVRTDLGRAYAELGRFAEAEASIRQAIDQEQTVSDRRNTALATLELGRVLTLENRTDEALPLLNAALDNFRAIGDSNSEANSLEAVAALEDRRGNPASARERMETALRLTEEDRTHADSELLRTSFFATRQDSYAFLIDLQMRLGDRAGALETSERSRARGMLDTLRGADIRSGVDPTLVNRERQITEKLNAKGSRLLPLSRTSPEAVALRQEIADLDQEFDDVEAALRRSSPRYAALSQPVPLKTAQIQRDLLDDGTLLLEFSLGERRSYLWAVGKTGLDAWELPARERIEAQVATVLGLLTERGVSKGLESLAERRKRIAGADASLRQAAKQLSAMVLGPAVSALDGRNRTIKLAIVPDGALQRLPFAMLPAGPSDAPLILSHEIVILPSASALTELRQQTSLREPAPKLLAVFADPVFDESDPRAAGLDKAAPPASAGTRILEHLAETAGGSSTRLRIPRLPYTAQEAERILGVAVNGANLKAIGFDANRAAATSPDLKDYRFIHFATHGYLDTERPSLSALVLSQLDRNNRPEDGFLRVDDIYNAALSADLVVLSACQTGLGQEVRGEGLMGLTRAFLYAGAPRVIVSLWNVNDRATADLMADLYRGMLAGGKRPAAALRAAQLEMLRRKQWASPYYWAAFVQHGDWR